MPACKRMPIFLIAVFAVLAAAVAGMSPHPFRGGAETAWAQDDAGKDGSKETEENGQGSENGCPECPDPAKVVLRGLEEKKQKIDADRKRLEEKREALERIEEQIDEKLAQLEKLKKQIDEDLALLDRKKSEKEKQKEALFEAKMDSLVKMYAGMKPKEAARIVDKMDIEVARQIFSRMRETAAAKILEDVGSEKAAKISESIAFKKE